jgi:hypothetical protein
MAVTAESALADGRTRKIVARAEIDGSAGTRQFDNPFRAERRRAR